MTPDSPTLLLDQVAVISGGSRGIGFAAATGLAKLGACVVIIGKTDESSQRAANSLVTKGFDAVGLGIDVSNQDEVSTKIGGHPIAGRADLLINCAGVMSEKMAKTLRSSTSEWDRVMSVNFNGTLNLIQAVAPNMVERRSGRIINVSACLGRFTGPGLAGGLAPYRVSKTAVNALTKNLAAELGSGKRGILVDAMCPNHTRTDMGGPDAPRSPEEAADTIIWLATRAHTEGIETGLLWEDRQIVPW
ncbi:MAG: SDR family NAD(P)-dependent oxidoreductase [Actinobacteria bacterium]|nr:SDR family NAD(P)-dependent oxidoreductase [Actinomycetota bacterium]